MIAFAKVNPARRVTLTQEEFSSAFQLLRTVGVNGGRSYHALDVASGNVVTVHLMDRDDTDTQVRLADRLADLPDAARDGLLVGDVSGIPLVVTQFVTALTPLRSWLDASAASDDGPSTASEEEAYSVDACGPCIADVIDADESLFVLDESPLVDIRTLAPVEVVAETADEGRPDPVMEAWGAPEPQQVEHVVVTRAFVPPIDLDPLPPPPPMPLPHARPRLTGVAPARPAPQIVSGPPGQSFIAPAASRDATFVGSIAGLMTLGAVLGGAMYFMARG